MSDPHSTHEENAHNAGHEGHGIEEFKKHRNQYLMVFGALGVLTFVTVLVSYVPLGTTGNITVALIIAVIKASLVGAFFMHLISEKRTIYRIMIATIFFFAGLMGLSLLAWYSTITMGR